MVCLVPHLPDISHVPRCSHHKIYEAIFSSFGLIVRRSVFRCGSKQPTNCVFG